MLPAAEPVYGPLEEITVAEVEEAVKAMKREKAAGLSGVTAEFWKYLGREGWEWMCKLLNKNIARANMWEP